MATDSGSAPVSHNDLKLAELSKTHGPLASVIVNGKLHAFRMPSLEEFEDYQEALKTKRRGVVFRELAQLSCVTSLEELQEAFKAAPMLAVKIHDALVEMCGSEIEVTVKKG